MIRRARHGERGQAAVETLFAIPVMLILSVIGFQLFAITWTAQAVHVRARYGVIEKMKHKPCTSNSTIDFRASTTVPGDTGVFRAGKDSYTLTHTAYIVCRSPN